MFRAQGCKWSLIVWGESASVSSWMQSRRPTCEISYPIEFGYWFLCSSNFNLKHPEFLLVLCINIYVLSVRLNIWFSLWLEIQGRWAITSIVTKWKISFEVSFVFLKALSFWSWVYYPCTGNDCQRFSWWQQFTQDLLIFWITTWVYRFFLPAVPSWHSRGCRSIRTGPHLVYKYSFGIRYAPCLLSTTKW